MNFDILKISKPLQISSTNASILYLDLKNLTEEIDTHDSKRPICRFVPAIVSSTYKNNLPGTLVQMLLSQPEYMALFRSAISA